MLTFRSKAWHARLYRQAYVEDREWLDHPISGGEWREKSAEKASVVRARLDGGLMSICPYFWKTLYAFVVYCFIAWPWYAIRNFLRVNWRPTLVVLAVQAAVIALMGIWWVRGDIAAIPDRIVAWHQAWEAEDAHTRAILAKWEKEAREHEVFLRQNPIAAAAEKARDEARDRELEAKLAENDARIMAAFKRDLAKAAPWIIGTATAAALLIYFTDIVDIVLALFVLLIVIPLERTRWGRALLEAWAACVWWFLELPGRIYHAVRMFLRDTWQFLRGYVMAVKERVCPFITFVDGHPAT